MRVFLSSLALYAALATTAFAQSTIPPSLQPMYGPGEKSEASKQADAAFIAKVESMGMTRQQGAEKYLVSAWGAFQHGDLDGSILKFNQAWLLDPENPEVYHGFAAVTQTRRESPESIDGYFKTGLAKPGVTAAYLVDYARFLTSQSRFDDAISTAQKALDIGAARNARAQMSYAYFGKQDLAQACKWATDAKANGDSLEPPYIKTVCKN